MYTNVPHKKMCLPTHKSKYVIYLMIFIINTYTIRNWNWMSGQRGNYDYEKSRREDRDNG